MNLIHGESTAGIHGIVKARIFFCGFVLLKNEAIYPSGGVYKAEE